MHTCAHFISSLYIRESTGGSVIGRRYAPLFLMRQRDFLSKASIASITRLSSRYICIIMLFCGIYRGIEIFARDSYYYNFKFTRRVFKVKIIYSRNELLQSFEEQYLIYIHKRPVIPVNI